MNINNSKSAIPITGIQILPTHIISTPPNPNQFTPVTSTTNYLPFVIIIGGIVLFYFMK